MSLFSDMRGTVGRSEPVSYEEQARRRGEELRSRRRLHFAENSTWPRLDLDDLRFERHHVEHIPTGERYRIVRGEVMDAQFSPATAWYIGSDGGQVFLEDV